jgi:hypothetical protein
MADIEIDFFKVTRTDNGTSTRTLTMHVRGFGATGGDDDAEPDENVELAQQLGFASRPYLSDDTECIGIRRGDEILALVILDKSLSAQDLEEGETRMYGAREPSAVMRIRATGKIEVTAKSGQDIVLNGGTLKVARVSDLLKVGTLAGQAGPYPVVFTFLEHDGDGAPSGVTSIGNTATITGHIANSGGKSDVKA